MLINWEEHLPVSPTLNSVYDNKHDLLLSIHHESLQTWREVKTTHSDTTRLLIRCTVAVCTFSLNSHKRQDDNWYITTLVEHSCSALQSCKHKNATATFISSHPFFMDMCSHNRNITANDIVAAMKTLYAVDTSTACAYRARNRLLVSTYGSPEDSYIDLPAYLDELEERNPGSGNQSER
ncbi:hypothetical protein GEMRC1_010961 [Eukaryota sp. GEM-RC1]